MLELKIQIFIKILAHFQLDMQLIKFVKVILILIF